MLNAHPLPLALLSKLRPQNAWTCPDWQRLHAPSLGLAHWPSPLLQSWRLWSGAESRGRMHRGRPDASALWDMNSRECILRVLSSSYEQRSRRFSAQMCPRQNRSVQRVQVGGGGGGAAGRGRMKPYETHKCCKDHVCLLTSQHQAPLASSLCMAPPLHPNWFHNLFCWFCSFLRLSCFGNIINPPTRSGKSCWGSPAVL